MVVVSAVLGVVASGLAIPFAGLFGFAADKTAQTVDDLPQELETQDLPQKTRILDRNGRVIATIYDENRVNVRLKDVSKVMRMAIVSIEDSRFYEHGALDLRGTFRAFVTNQAASGVVQGGSTITQQLVKLTLLSAAKTDEEREQATDDSYARKLRELRYAIALEKEHSKDWILERYLNTAYFGDGAYGIQAAAKHYFSANARNLNLNQAATLAGLVQNPTKFDPTNGGGTQAIQRRDVVLDRMAQLGAITQQQADRNKKLGLQLKVKPANNGCVNSQVPLFCSYALNYLYQDPSLGRTVNQRKYRLRNAGLTIQTTVNLKYQKAADRAVSEAVEPRNRAIGALAIVQPGTGEVMAISQSRPVGRKKKLGETFLNYVVPKRYGNANGFQGGSTFKVFTLAAAIEQGIPLNRTYNSPSPKTFDQADFENCPGAPNFAGTFEVPNSTTSGLKNLYSGTRESVNTFYMQLEADTGVCGPFRLAKAMGVELTCPGQKSCPGKLPERIPNFTLGVADVSPLEMAEAYATFAARGTHCDSRPIQEIRDAAGRVLKTYQPRCQRVMQKSTADAVSDVLRGVIEPGGFASAQALDSPAAGKTGTTNDGKSVWFCGYTPHMAAAAMVAGANRFGTPTSLEGVAIRYTTIFGASGSGVAAPIWGAAMRVVDNDLPNDDFVYPEDIAGVGQEFVPAPDPPEPRGGRGGGGGDGDGGGGNGNGNGNGGGRGGGRGGR